MSTCRKCNAEIRWVRMLTGKSMPVDPELVWSEQAKVGDKLITPTGEVITVREDSDASGYVPHWSTCPNADEFRRKS